MSSKKATSPKARGQKTAATLSSPVSQSSAWFRAKGAKQRKGQKVPSATSFIQPHNPRT